MQSLLRKESEIAEKERERERKMREKEMDEGKLTDIWLDSTPGFFLYKKGKYK